MKDDTLTVMVETACAVAYLSTPQIDAYGGIDQAKLSLGVDYIACPLLYHEKTLGQLPDFYECGHG